MSFDAKTALDQLTNSNNGMNRLTAMIGGYGFAKDDNNQSVRFKFKAGRGFNYCEIKLDPTDTYTMTLQKYNWTKFKLIESGDWKTKKFEGLYHDQLKETFEQNTKLYLSL